MKTFRTLAFTAFVGVSAVAMATSASARVLEVEGRRKAYVA